MPARIHHVSIFVRDLDRALGLFHGLLGLPVVQRLEGVRGGRISALLGIPDFKADMVFLKHPDQKACLELVRQTGGEDAAREDMRGFGISLTVEDLDGLHAELNLRGWSPLSEPLEMMDPSGRPIRLFCFHTEEGLMVELIQKAG